MKDQYDLRWEGVDRWGDPGFYSDINHKSGGGGSPQGQQSERHNPVQTKTQGWRQRYLPTAFRRPGNNECVFLVKVNSCLYFNMLKDKKPEIGFFVMQKMC